ncbi:MAG: hypothetical protein LBS69_02740, partial [Prevotellaceae bacterium]|nr:hypothetical protein [Prevotellaceae bacterium]
FVFVSVVTILPVPQEVAIIKMAKNTFFIFIQIYVLLNNKEYHLFKGTPKNYFVYFDFYRKPKSPLKLRIKIGAKLA